MADHKWIDEIKPRMRQGQAASIALPLRLKAVLHHLPQAAKEAHRDPEHVHQLRVASRRAAAALEIFAEALPEKCFKRLRQQLKVLRRSAGEARDWDVFAGTLHEAPALHDTPARDLLLGVTAARRLDAQVRLQETVKDDGREFEKDAGALDDKDFEWQKVPTKFGEFALQQIRAHLQELDKRAEPPPEKYAELHEFRILGKHLRYSMEVFANCFTSPFREEIYPQVEQMQEILGRITDAHVAGDRMRVIQHHLKVFHPADWPRYHKPIDELLRTLKQQFTVEREHFLKWLPIWREFGADKRLETLMK